MKTFVKTVAGPLLKLLKAFALTVVFVHLLVYGALHSGSASRYLADLVTERVPAFEATAMKGNLVRGLSFDAEYRDGSRAVTLHRVTLRIAPACLWGLRLCIEELSAAAVDIVIYPAAAAAPAAVEKGAPLAAVSTPLTIVLNRLQLQAITVRQAQAGVVALSRLELQGSWRKHRIRIVRAVIDHQACRAIIGGEIQLRGFYPLQTRIECDTDSALGRLTGTVAGDLKQLSIAVESGGAWPLGAAAALSVLDPQQALQATVKLLEPVRLEDSEFELQRGELALKGTPEHLALELNTAFASPLLQGENHLGLHGIVAWSEQSNLLQVDLQSLQGVVMQQAVSGSGRLSWREKRLAVEDFTLRQHANRIRIDGVLEAGSAAVVEAAIDFPELQRLWPPLSGAVSATLAASGDPFRPTVRGRLAGRDLNYQGTAVESAQLHFHLPELGRRDSDIDIDLEKISLREQSAGDLRAGIEGGLGQHRLSVDWKHPHNYSVSLLCRGQSAAGSLWQGQCSSLQASLAAQTWKLRDTVQLRYDGSHNSAQIAPLCLIDAGGTAATLCSRDPVTVAGSDIKGLSLTGEHLDWALLEPWLPAAVSVRGNWRFDLDGGLAGGQPGINASLESDTAAIHWQGQAGRQLQVPLLQLAGGLQFANGKAVLTWSADGGDYGRAGGTLGLGPQTIDGAATVAGARLAVLEPLLAETAVEALAGQLDMDVRISGDRRRPRLNGGLKISDARTRLENLPLPFEAIDMDIAFSDRSARLQGKFEVAAAPGNLAGQLAWSEAGLSGELSADAAQVLLRPDDVSEITLSPSVVLALTPQQIRLSGTVAVPRARVRLTQLPAQAVSPSADTVIVGLEREKSGGPELVSDITLQLGDDVVFRGFGLDTRLTGELAVKQSAAEGTRASGVVRLQQGRYRAYGQALAIREGDLIFVGDVDNPQLRVEAVREMDSDAVVVGLRATGPARSPAISLFSQPQMAEQAKLHYLLTGRPPGTTATQDPNVLAAQTALSLGINRGDSVINKTAGALGIDNFRMSAEGGSDGPEMRLSGYLSSNLLVRYGIGVFDAVNSLTLRYQVGRNLYIEAVSGQSNSLDLLWSFERR